MRKKVVSVLMAATMLTGSITALAGCGGNGNGSSVNAKPDARIATVRMYKAGYGTKWLEELATKFNETYYEEGIAVSIVSKRGDYLGSTMSNELIDPNGTDLYVAGRVFPEDFELCENLEETVWNQKPISFDGTEENILYKDKVTPGLDMWADNENHEGRYVGYYLSSIAGYIVNQNVLDAYELEIPNTTDEMYAAFEKIQNSATPSGLPSKVYPHTYPGGVNGYPSATQYTWLAQRIGYDDYTKFASLSENDTWLTEDGYKCYQDERLIDVYEETCRIYDYAYADLRSLTQSVDSAQGTILLDEAAFYPCGAWFYREMYADYPDEMENMRFIPVPMISALGEEIFGEGKDELYSYAIGLADAGKSADEIVADALANKGEKITEDQAALVIERRGYNNDRGVEHMAVIPKDSEEKDIAALFLRYIASDDAARVMAQYATGLSCFSSNIDFSQGEYSSFFQDVIKVGTYQETKMINKGADAGTLAKKLPDCIGLMSMNIVRNDCLPNYLATLFEKQTSADALKTSRYEYVNDALTLVRDVSVYRDCAEYLFHQQADHVAKEWTGWISGLAD